MPGWNNTDVWYSDVLKIDEPDLKWLQMLREENRQAFITQDLPTRKIEAWHYTDVSLLKQHRLKQGKPVKLPAVDATIFFEKDHHRLVFIDGCFNAELSKIQSVGPGVVLSNIASVLKTQPELVKPYLIEFSKDTQDAFACFNTAMFQDGVFLYLPQNTQITEPIHIVCLNSADCQETNTAHLRHVLVIGQNSCVDIFEDYQSLPASNNAQKDFYFSTAVTHLLLAKNAVVNHHKLQNENTAACSIGRTVVKQDQGSSSHLHHFALGCTLARDNVQVDLVAEGAHTELSGLYMLAGEQHIDQQVLVNHYGVRASSDQLYRGVIGDTAIAVFNSRVFVHKGAKKTKSKQSNQNLLLSRTATVNTKPEFEIYDDDVACQHGATVGSVDEAAFFYLCARGLDEVTAKKLLMEAFVGEVLKKMTISSIYDIINTAIEEKIKQLGSNKT